MIKQLLFLIILLGPLGTAMAQNEIRVKVIDQETREPLIGATVLIGEKGAITNVEGYAVLQQTDTDTVDIKVSFVGYEPYSAKIALPQTQPLIVSLKQGEELEEVIVTSTRSTRTIEDAPSRVEVIGTEELAEKAIMRSSNIAMVLRESTGIQMQQTSASSANQSIRIQGLDGRYTQILKDGFPLYSGFAGGLSIMQIPPLDLQQVEILKGSHSTLYGGGAIAGLVNLVTIVPKDERMLKLMVDQTSAGGTTFNSFVAEGFGKVGMTIYTSANRQQAYDPNDDDFSDIPQIRSLTLNPSLFLYFNEKSKLRLTLNGTSSERVGGDMTVINGGQNGTHQFTETNKSNRFSYQIRYDTEQGENRTLTAKHSLTYFDRQISEPDFTFKGEQWSSFTELSHTFGSEKSRWITGLNVYTDRFIESPFDELVRSYEQMTFGVFGQNTAQLTDVFALESGLRLDHSPDYGNFALPRFSLLSKLNTFWSFRLGGGLGYKLPTIFTEEAENLTYQGILPIQADDMTAERSIGGNFDLNFRTSLGDHWTLSLNQLFFYTQLTDALVFRQNTGGQYFFENADGAVDSRGVETNLKLTYRDFKLFANYALIETRLNYDNLNEQKPLTPKHNIGAVLVYEVEDKWRIGLESYYTGSQYRSDRSQTSDYWIAGFMAMRKFNKLSLYVNFENFTDTRQHRLENFDVSDHFKPDFPEIWAPTDGRVINAGIILEL